MSKDNCHTRKREKYGDEDHGYKYIMSRRDIHPDIQSEQGRLKAKGILQEAMMQMDQVF